MSSNWNICISMKMKMERKKLPYIIFIPFAHIWFGSMVDLLFVWPIAELFHVILYCVLLFVYAFKYSIRKATETIERADIPSINYWFGDWQKQHEWRKTQPMNITYYFGYRENWLNMLFYFESVHIWMQALTLDQKDDEKNIIIIKKKLVSQLAKWHDRMRILKNIKYFQPLTDGNTIWLKEKKKWS